MDAPSSIELEGLLERWRREVYGNSSANPVSILSSIADIMERETEAYLKLPIDPFDDRHPSRASPDCTLGNLLKMLFKNESLMSELTNEYITATSNAELHVVSCRLLLDILPGLDSTVVFMESEDLVKQLLEWAENASFPLHSYATGLLAAAMDVPGISNMYREQNNHLVPIIFTRLHQLTHGSSDEADQTADNIDPKDLVDVGLNRSLNQSRTSDKDSSLSKVTPNGAIKRPYMAICDDETLDSRPGMEKKASQTHILNSPMHNECSSSSWAEAYMSGSYQMNPLSTVMQQRFILQYLSALGEYQELLVHVFEHKALSYVLQFIDGRKNPDVRLAFDALKFLASFLSHKKFALEFLDHGGLPQLLRVNRHAMASSGVSICLYYLAYNEDVMERICWMKRETVEKMISYGLWLLECSHDSSRAHSAMFFSLCFQFPLLLKLFDRDAGLRKLLNVISMRGLFSDDPNVNDIPDDETFTRRHTAKQACIALKKYTRAHFISETRKHTRTTLQTCDQECKPTTISDENFIDAVELHRQQSLQRFNWQPIDRIVQEDGYLYLLKIIAHFWSQGILYGEKSETVRSGLEVLVVCSLSPKVQRLLLKTQISTDMPYALNHQALSIIVMCADPKIDDPDCKKLALNILINLVHTEHQARVPAPALNVSLESNDFNRSVPGGARKKGPSRNFDLSIALKKAIWDNNGTLILPKLLTVTSPLTEADKIRSLACRVLCGLAKEESIRQIMSKLPMFIDGQLQSLMKEPILPEKRIEHALFCKYSRELIELVTGTPVTSISGVEPSLAEIKRKMIVAKTKIVYDETESDHIIYQHLISKGYLKAAAEFYKEANLSSRQIKAGSASIARSTQTPRSPPLAPLESSQSQTPIAPQTPSTRRAPVDPSSPGPVHFKQNPRTPNCNSLNLSCNSKSSMLQKSNLQHSHLYRKLTEPQSSSPITLDSIFTEYLRNQHSQCKNPVAICPPFKLLAPHSCPEPTNRLSAPVNIASRIIRRQIEPPHGGFDGARFDRHYVYSRFRPIRLMRDSFDVRTSATCCAFSTDGQFLFVGTDGGLLKAFDMSTGMMEASYECHGSEIGYIEASNDDNLILTTSPDSPSPQCLLWTFTDVFERKQRFDEDLHAEFGKASSDRIVSTQELFARLWDTATGSMLHKFEGYHRYTSNRATFNYNDTLILNDGVLWDVRNASIVHKFGKFNERINGIFHPNGNEIICNSHIWDIRNFRSLRTVPAFDSCQLKFNSGGDVIFSTILDDQSEPTKYKNEFKTSFRTFDSYDYSTIATIDLKRTISDLAVSSGDQHIALIESSGNARCLHEEYATESNICRLYEVGRSRDDADMDLVDDEDAEDEENDDDDEDDDDDVGGMEEDFEDFEEMYDSDESGDMDDDDDDDDDDDGDVDEIVAGFHRR